MKKNAANAANGGSKAARNRDKQAPIDDKKVKTDKKTVKQPDPKTVAMNRRTSSRIKDDSKT